MKVASNWKEYDFNKIIDLYNSVGWSNYTEDKDSLLEAFQNSTFVACSVDEEDNLLGVVRSVSDDVSIHYLQDLLVNPDFHRNGVGRALLDSALERFKHVRTHMILTDDEEKQLKFYQSLGYKNTKDLKDIPLNAFVRMNGIELS